MYYHDIEAILGIKLREEGWDLPDNIADLEEGDGPEYSPHTQTIDDFFTDEGVARVDVKFDGKPTKRYMDPRQLLNIQQGAGGEKSEIKYEKVRYEVTGENEPPVEPKDVIKAQGNIPGRRRKDKHDKMFDDTRDRPTKTPPDWDFDMAEKPEIPDDWTDNTKPVGADPRGHKGKHRYKRGGNFVVTEDGEVIWTE